MFIFLSLIIKLFLPSLLVVLPTNGVDEFLFHQVDCILLLAESPLDVISSVINKFELLELQIGVLGLFFPLFSLLLLALISSVDLLSEQLVLLLFSLKVGILVLFGLPLLPLKFLNNVVDGLGAVSLLHDGPSLHNRVLQFNPQVIGSKFFIIVMLVVVVEDVVKGDRILWLVDLHFYLFNDIL